MKNIEKRLIERLIINNYKIFHISDVRDLGTHHYLMTTIYNLKKEGWIKKLNSDGYYEFLGINYYDNLYCPASGQDIANFIMRKFKWRLVPAGDYAMAIMGVGRECEEYCYISDKKDLRVELNDSLLLIERVDRSLFEKYSYNTLLVLEVLKAIGIKDITDDHLRIISKKLWRREKEILYQEIKDIKSKFKECLLYICRH